jgi:uncharacterized protein
MSKSVALVSAVAVAALVVVFTVTRDQPAAAQPERRTVSVTGTAVVHTVPDTVVWHLTTTDEHSDLERAMGASDRKLQAVLAAARRIGLAEADLQTGHLRVDREFYRDEWGNSTRFRHWNVVRDITLTERSIDDFDAMLTALVSAADVEMRYELRSSRIHDLRAGTRLDAVGLARTKAEAMVNELGGELGDALTVEEQSSGGRPFNPLANAAFYDTGTMHAADATQGTFAPGTIEVRISVWVTFAIE